MPTQHPRQRATPTTRCPAVAVVRHSLLGVLVAGLVATGPCVAAQTPQIDATEAFATVDDTVITVEEYVATLRNAVRNTYYHGQVPQAEMAQFQRRVAGDLVDRILLVAEARRRGIEPDREAVSARMARIEERYGDNEEFLRNREAMLAALEEQLVENSLVARLEERVRDLPDPSEAEVREYYEANKDKFVEPEQIRVSAILLKVDPSAPRAVWDAAREEAEQLRERLEDGADFAELARLHSADGSADKGGDMGYLHRGMLGQYAQDALDELSAGGVTPPVDLLEGIGLFKLEDRRASRQNSFEAVRERATDLLRRDRSEQAWLELKEELRNRATVSVRQDLFLPETTDPASVHGAAPAPDAAQ